METGCSKSMECKSWKTLCNILACFSLFHAFEIWISFAYHNPSNSNLQQYCFQMQMDKEFCYYKSRTSNWACNTSGQYTGQYTCTWKTWSTWWRHADADKNYKKYQKLQARNTCGSFPQAHLIWFSLAIFSWLWCNSSSESLI